MKRIISLFLVILLCILNIDPNGLYSYADKINEFKIVYVCVNVNGNTKRLPAIQNENKKLFFSGKTLSEITVYNNQSDEMFFQHDKATELCKYREIVIHSELKGAKIKYKNVHYIIPEYYEAVGYKQREEYYELNLIDGRWKYSDCSTIIEDTETNFYSNKGIVTTESTALNLTAYGSIYAEIIAEIPRNSTVTILDSTLLLSSCPDGKWYLVDYKGQVGYVSADYIQITEEKVKLTEKQLINIAQLRYYEGLNAKHWQMCSCFELEHNNTFNESEYRYILLKNIHSKDDWFEQVHTLFSKKYDDYYECDGIINNGDNYPVYLEKENNWYICDVVYRKGDIPVGLLSVDKHNIIEFEVESINENEVVFRGVINWDEVDYEYSEEQEIISEFSIVYEDGHWKCGKLPI